MKTSILHDVSELPTYGFGTRMTMAWGTMAFILIEGTGFAIAAAAYFYLAWLNPEWPLSAAPPGLLWSGLITLLMLVSLWPNQRAKARAEEHNLPAVQLHLLVMSAIGLGLLALRAAEFATLHVKWDANAYGSFVWLLLGLHTTHLATDVIDTIVLTALMFTRHAHGKRFSDVTDNAFYWYFVVASWLPIYFILYWTTRL
ncbi:MAG: putative cytochrome c oxidase subunit protein [Hyphomicrobiales bacterium]|jgi:cytochrome c oxidase subunit 3|nr:putative cytochrome c oxidase subunit protein [Hyphomicrobiales bacterium]